MPRRVLNRVVLLALLGLFTTVAVAALLALLADVRQGPATQSSGYDLKGRWTVSRWDRAGAVQIHFSRADRKSTRLNSSHANISYAVFCLKKKKEGEAVKL